MGWRILTEGWQDREWRKLEQTISKLKIQDYKRALLGFGFSSNISPAFWSHALIFKLVMFFSYK